MWPRDAAEWREAAWGVLLGAGVLVAIKPYCALVLWAGAWWRGQPLP